LERILGSARFAVNCAAVPTLLQSARNDPPGPLIPEVL
jgi:hypothetical protein